MPLFAAKMQFCVAFRARNSDPKYTRPDAGLVGCAQAQRRRENVCYNSALPPIKVILHGVAGYESVPAITNSFDVPFGLLQLQ